MNPQSIQPPAKTPTQGDSIAQQQLPQQRHAVGKLLISLLILGVLTAQAYTALLRMVCNSKDIPIFCAVPKDPSLYPFLDYPMYSRIEREGATVGNRELIAIFADGTERTLTPEDFGTSLYWFNALLLTSFGNQQIPEIESYIADYEAAGNPPFVAFRFKNNLYIVEKKGITTAEPEEFTMTLPLSAP